MTYAQALRYLHSFTNYRQEPAQAYAPARYHLDRMPRFLDHLGRPQDRFRSVQVAGTKGKGSTAAMLAATLHAAGQRVGLYTSPHLHTFRERARVGDTLISETEFARLVDRIRPAVDATHRDPALGRLTTFEIATVLALLHFAEANADVAVLEAGIGGRLDATNVVDPVLSVITPISLDHNAILGDTVAAIAGEKAGIVKPGVPVVVAPQPPEAGAVIRRVAHQQAAPLIQVGLDWTWTVQASTPEGLRLDLAGPDTAYTGLHLPLIGDFQALNAATAVAAAAQLDTQLGAQLDTQLGAPEPAIRQGLAQVRWPARLEVLARQDTLARHPWVVADSAHNGDSARKLAAALRDVFQPRRIILVLGLSRGHNLGDILDALLPLADHVIATQPRRPRVLAAAALQAAIVDRGGEASAVESVPQALERALALAGPADLVCAAALFVAAEARAFFHAPGSELRDPVDRKKRS